MLCAMDVAWRSLIIGPDADPSLGHNIQGPSVIRTPSWVVAPLGRYLCYFADHKGDHIRLAYADEIAGPWTVVPGGCLSLSDSHFLTEAPSVTRQQIDEITELYEAQFGTYETVDMEGDLTAPHIASPDVRVNHELQEIELWFHGLEALGVQQTRYATSVNGVDFVAQAPLFDATYLRVFRVEGQDYGLAMPGKVFRRRGGPVDFEAGPTILPPTSRHMAAWVVGDELRVFYSEVGDAPERIKMVTVDVTHPWANWTASAPIEVMRPAEAWEGADLSTVPSIRGLWPEPANQLRDPAIFTDIDGQTYLFYAAAGECGIGVALLVD